MVPTAVFGAWHRPRALGFGLIVFGAGGLLMAMPSFLGDYDMGVRQMAGQLCTRVVGDVPLCAGEASPMFGFLLGAQLLFAIGAAPLYIHGQVGSIATALQLCFLAVAKQHTFFYSDSPFLSQTFFSHTGLSHITPFYPVLPQVWIDENVSADKVPVYLSCFFAMSAVGAALGNGLNSSFLLNWVDGADKAPEGVTPIDAGWVGAWWISCLIIAVVSVGKSRLLLLLPFYFFFCSSLLSQASVGDVALVLTFLLCVSKQTLFVFGWQT
jgi:hypothetical protein